MKGVRNIEKRVEKAVKLTESAAFPFAKWLIKLETFPPGQAATKNIPKATDGGGWIINMNIHVKNGRKRNWLRIPARNDFGSFHIAVKSETLRSKATPNIMIASEIFKNKSDP